jgi:hypothetical protein
VGGQSLRVGQFESKAAGYRELNTRMHTRPLGSKHGYLWRSKRKIARARSSTLSPSSTRSSSAMTRIEPVDWESCAEVLDAEAQREVLLNGWKW